VTAAAAGPGMATVAVPPRRGSFPWGALCAPGLEDASLLDAVSRASLAAFGAQSPGLARRYRDS
jgi:hypothetical protein